MSIAVGTRLGSYQITSSLGEGGMGQVYRATDTKLNREVALKFLPAQFASDRDRMDRFHREAQVLASLNHSNIAAIYGLEDSSSVRALVIELVDGPTLADRIAQGPIPIEETLSIAKQIADALEYAHDRGVVHRDLKPANIKLTADGKVKVLDFGLAKAMSTDVQPSTFSNSPTLSLAATQAGLILGTAGYMSPEQAKGKQVDRRADIWAFGVVLYEMLTGSRMFVGETVAETMAQVMMKEPDFAPLPPATPSRLRDLLRRCLTKEPRNRTRDIGDVRIAIEEIIANPEVGAPEQPSAPASETTKRRNRAIPWAAAAVLAISLGIVGWNFWRYPLPSGPMRLTAELGADVSLSTGNGAAAFLSPDGKTLAFIAAKADGQSGQIYIRRLDQLQASPLSGTEGARNAFFSPDGQWIAYFAAGKLKKIGVNGGASVTLCDAEEDRGGAWADDGSIVFTPNPRSGLFRVPSSGGKPEAITKLDSGEVTHRWPYVLPGSQIVLFTSSPSPGDYESANIAARSLPTGEVKIVLRGGYYPRYASTGHLLYLHEGTLFAAQFDSAHLAITAQPIPVLEGVTSAPGNGTSQFALSENGTLAYLAGGSTTPAQTISWMDHNGKTQLLRPTRAPYLNWRFRPRWPPHRV
jgi:serine/threonine-protein kinase